MRSTTALLTCLFLALGATAQAKAEIIVTYTHSAGGNNTEPLNGLSAQATFSINNSLLTILLENTSAGVPASFEVSDSLLVSLGFNLGQARIQTGDAAVIGPDSAGLGAWSSLGPDDSVAEQWLWTNDCGGDLLESFPQVISTSSGQGGGQTLRFDGTSGNVDGPFGGIAAQPPLINVPGSNPAVSNAIRFELTLTQPLTEQQLLQIAHSSIVEFGSDERYLHTPEPASLILLVLGAAVGWPATARRSRLLKTGNGR